MKFFALLLRGIHGRGGGSDVYKRQPSGVAMGEDPHAVADQFRAVSADLLAMAHIFSGEFLGSGQGQRLLFSNGFTPGHGGADAVHGIDGIDGGGPGGGQGLINGFEMALEPGEVAPLERARPWAKP